jgi:LysM repeat protein
MITIGQKIKVRSGARYDVNNNSFDDPNSRGYRTETVTKVMSHGVRTRESGYINNKRILRGE